MLRVEISVTPCLNPVAKTGPGVKQPVRHSGLTL
jgi:hypothetical protein